MTVDAWTAAAMCLLSLPRSPSRTERRETSPLP
jgi:hypothetical protein